MAQPPRASHRHRFLAGALVFAAAMSGAMFSCDTAHEPTGAGLSPRSRIHRDASPYWPDEPVGFATISDYGFGDSIPAGNGVPLGTSRWSINFNSAGGVTQATNQTGAPVSPPDAGEWTFPVGFSGGSAGIIEYDDTIASKEVFLEFTFNASSPFEDPGHPRELIEIVGNSVSYAVTLESLAGGTHRLDVTRAAGQLTPNMTTSDAMLGAWHTVELYIKYSSTATATDGIVRWWVNDTLQGEYTGETMAADGGLYETRVEARWDGSGTKAIQDEVWYDQVHVSRAAPPPEPQFDSTSNGLLWQDHFDAPTRAGIEASYSIMLGHYPDSTGDTDYVHADPTGGENGTGALRMDWRPNPDTLDATCPDDWTGIDRGIPGAPTEIFVQYSVRYQPGFAFDWQTPPSKWGHPCEGNAKKLFLVWSGDNKSRFIFVTSQQVFNAGSDYEEAIGPPYPTQNTADTMTLSQFADGNWHRVTFHFKQSSTTTATDGFLYGWIDGVLRFSRPNWASGSIGGWVEFKAPSTFNAGSPFAQSEWMDNLTIWKPSP